MGSDSAESPPPVSRSRPAPAGGRILVVDDNEMNRDLLSRRLRQQGHTVSIAENGRQALEKIGAEELDLVMLDIMMPELDGYQVLEKMRADGTLERLPVVMISAVTEIESVVRCIEMGATDYLPKPFNTVLLKARVGATLEKKRLRDRERLWAESMERELEIGRQIQRSFLPEELPQPPGWEIAAKFEPARQVAGDFYDAFPLAGGTRVGLVLADVCDKGVGAALFMALFRSLVRAFSEREYTAASSDPDPDAARVLSTILSTNDYIAKTHGRSNMFATLFFGVLDPAGGGLTWVNAGHEAPVVFGPAGTTARLAPTGPALGMMPDMKFEARTALLSPGEILFAFTDGVTEARDAAGRQFSEERLLALVAEGSPSAAAFLDAVLLAVTAHAAGVERSDDITMLAARRTLK
ncbi:MAG TPA: fused response regulator/phosphatase [Thermoanaerobaculia bacterium]|nr:fused response regulator/phosphatase [Thermoanaerobaculia bacterium]